MSEQPFKILDSNNVPVTMYGYSSTQFVVGQDGASPYTTIQDAIDAAKSLTDISGIGQVVYVKPGIYDRGIKFYPGVTVIGADTPSTLDDATYVPDLSKNHGVFVVGKHGFEEQPGEFNIKNIIFFHTAAGDSAIFDLTGNTFSKGSYNFENCKFFSIKNGVIAPFIECTADSYLFEGLLFSFRDCLFHVSDRDPTLETYNMFHLKGANTAKYVFNSCTIKSTMDSSYNVMLLEDNGLGDNWYPEFSNCKISNVPIKMGGSGSAEVNLSIDNCRLLNDRDPVVTMQDTNAACRITNSYVYIINPNGRAIEGDAPIVFDSTNTAFVNGSGNTTQDWVAGWSTWPDISNNTLASSGPVYCVYSDNDNQPATSPNTAYAMRFNTLEEAYGISVQNDTQSPPQPTKITFQFPGVYNLQFSAQLDRVSGSGLADVNIWLRKNGTNGAANVPRTDTKITMAGNENSSKTVAAWNFMFTAQPGDYFQLAWSTTDHNVHIIAASPDTTVGQERPAIPSVILTVYKIK